LFTVISQSPSAGTHVAPGSSVDFTYSISPKNGCGTPNWIPVSVGRAGRGLRPLALPAWHSQRPGRAHWFGRSTGAEPSHQDWPCAQPSLPAGSAWRFVPRARSVGWLAGL